MAGNSRHPDPARPGLGLQREPRFRVLAAGGIRSPAPIRLCLFVAAIGAGGECLRGAERGRASGKAATREGTTFIFGYLGGGAAPFAIPHPEHAFVLAFESLPLILLVSVLSALLFHWRVLPLIVRGFAWMLRKVFSVGGAVSVSTAANVFVGMTEAPLLIRPYLRDMSRAGLFMVMTAGIATIAGNMFVLYATILAPMVYRMPPAT